MTREENAREAARLRSEGLSIREIAERMGVAKSTASEWLCDPDGSKLRARKDTYRGECLDCGGRTDGSNGRDKAPERCMSCRNAHEAEATKATVIDAIRRWNDLHGEPPRVHDWSPDHARLAGKPYRGEGWPSLTVCSHSFGNLHAAIRAAGLEPAPWAEQPAGLDTQAVARRYTEDPAATVKGLARELGVREQTVRYHLAKAGVPTRHAPGTEQKIQREDWPEIVRLYAEGLTQAEIAARFDCSTFPIYRALKLTGTPTRPRGRRRSAIEERKAA